MIIIVIAVCSCCLLYCDCHRKPYFMTTIIRWDRGCFRSTYRYNVYYSCCYHSHCYDFQKQNIPKQSFSIASFILIFISYSPQPSDSQHRDITFLVRDPNLNLYVPRLHLGKGDNPKDITQLYHIISFHIISYHIISYLFISYHILYALNFGF